jgi:NTP pyrophosphatase (non-canonical NTP hydrolase)
MVQVDTELQAEVVNKYGKEIQSTICMEECAELIQAISKMKRGKDNIDNLIEEMADVLIAFSQLRYIYGITDDDIIEWLDAKQDRQRRLLYGGE